MQYEVLKCTSTCSIGGTCATVLTQHGGLCDDFEACSRSLNVHEPIKRLQTVKRTRDIKLLTLVPLTPCESTIEHNMYLSKLIVLVLV
jgi:hypothetical protein